MSILRLSCMLTLFACSGLREDPPSGGAGLIARPPASANSAGDLGGSSAIASDAGSGLPTTTPMLALPVAGSKSLAAECVTTGTIAASLRPTNLLFLIDRSSSMNCNLPPVTSSAQCELSPAKAVTSAPSKWEVVRMALEAAIKQLPGDARAGISYFSNDDMCGVQSVPYVPIRPLDSVHRDALRHSLDAVRPRGGTPIVGGLILAYKHLNPDQTPSVPNGNRFVVLLTDGQEGCAVDQTMRLLATELPKSRQAGIATFVIGVPGSEVNRSFLSRLAFAGGTPSSGACNRSANDPSAGDCHFDMTLDTDLAAGLSRALAAIGGEALRCEFDVPRPANGEELDYDMVNIVYSERGGAEERVIAQDARQTCDLANGWQYNQGKTKILLCGAACDTVRGAASIRIALGCKTAVLL